MTRDYKRLGALLCGLAATAALAGTAVAAHRAHHGKRHRDANVPGVSKHRIRIGGTFPLTGPASLYKTVPAAERAYYAYVNAHGGVHGRKIEDIVLNDRYDPSRTLPQTRKLVERYHVFADVGSLGTAPNLAIWGYLNQHKVPHVLVGTGDAYWGQCVHRRCDGTRKPWTMGWQPDHPGEARLYAKYILRHRPKARIGVLYQDDAYGKDYLRGLKAGLGSHRNRIVDAEPYAVSETTLVPQIVALETHGADTFLVFATPAPTIQALATAAAVHWAPLTLIANVSANRLFMLTAAQNGANVDGVISTTYLASQTMQPQLKGMKLAKQIIHRYAPSLDRDFADGDLNLVYGLASAWTFVYGLEHAGENPTRRSLMKALRNLNTTQNPFLFPGMRLRTSQQRTFPLEQLILSRWKGGKTGDWHTFGRLVGGVR